MNVQDYFNNVISRFDASLLQENSPEKIVAYEEVFKWEWFATKLKIFSFVTYSPSIDLQMFENYSSNCLKYAKQNKHGLPIGWQNGVVSFNVMVSESIPIEISNFAQSKPKKHYSAFEMPVAIDLSMGKICYYQGDIIWGMMYSAFIKDYILRHFTI